MVTPRHERGSIRESRSASGADGGDSDETERLRPLEKFFGDKPLLRIKAEDITVYQKARQVKGVSGRTINMEIGVVRRMLKRAKRWNAVAEDVEPFPECQRQIGQALPAEQKKYLFEVAGSNPDWMVAYCAAVLAASTTCRGVEVIDGGGRFEETPVPRPPAPGGNGTRGGGGLRQTPPSWPLQAT